MLTNKSVGCKPRVQHHRDVLPATARSYSKRASSKPSHLLRQLSKVHASSEESGNASQAPSRNITSADISTDELDSNQLQTLLALAIQNEDYELAAAVRDLLQKELGNAELSRMDWRYLGIPDWLAERAERVGFKFPTEVQRRAAPVILSGSDAIIQSATGSGKTFSFMVPAIARLDYPPAVYPDDLKGPQCIIVVPTMELGVQFALQLFKMYGGNISVGQPGDPSNIFAYTGPRGIKVRGLLNKEEIVMAKGTPYLSFAHVVVATPAALVETYSEPDAVPLLDFLKVVVIDEVDECFKKETAAMIKILDAACAKSKAGGEKPQIVYVGATVSPFEVELSRERGWLSDPVEVVVGQRESLSVPKGLKHRVVVVPEATKLAQLVRVLRADLAHTKAEDGPAARAVVFASDDDELRRIMVPMAETLWGEHQVAVLLNTGMTYLTQNDAEALPGPRDENIAQISAGEPIRALQAFRDHKASLLLCGPNAARGLDLPAVSHVYNLGTPYDATQYLHRAGRAGRIGSFAGAVVTSVVSESELPQLQHITSLLGVELEKIEVFEEAPLTTKDVDGQRRGLEDLFKLM